MSTTTKEEYVVINKNDMVAIADVVRPLIGTSDTMSVVNLKANLDSVKTNIDNTFAALEEKGISIPANGNVGDIADLIGNMSSGGGGVPGETWVINDSPLEVPNDVIEIGEATEWVVAFTSNGQRFTSISWRDEGDYIALYFDEVGTFAGGYSGLSGTTLYGSWGAEKDSLAKYRKVTFDAAPSGDLLTWLEANAVKQESDTIVQESKSVTMSSNGTMSVTPDAPYDAIGKVDLTVNVMEDLMKFFGGSKYYITSVTPTSSYANTITVTVPDASILKSPKFLLIIPDIPSTQSLNDGIAVQASSSMFYASCRMAFKIGKTSASISLGVYDSSGGTGTNSGEWFTSGTDVFDGTHCITISGGKITIDSYLSDVFFNNAWAYKVLLIG